MRMGTRTPSPEMIACWLGRLGNAPEHAARDVGHGARDELLVGVAAETQREDRAALRERGCREFRRPLRDQRERDAVLAAFLGYPGDDAGRFFETDPRIGGNVAMRFFADQ